MTNTPVLLIDLMKGENEMTKTTNQRRTAASIVEDIRKIFLELQKDADCDAMTARLSMERLSVVKTILEHAEKGVNND